MGEGKAAMDLAWAAVAVAAATTSGSTFTDLSIEGSTNADSSVQLAARAAPQLPV